MTRRPNGPVVLGGQHPDTPHAVAREPRWGRTICVRHIDVPVPSLWVRFILGGSSRTIRVRFTAAARSAVGVLRTLVDRPAAPSTSLEGVRVGPWGREGDRARSRRRKRAQVRYHRRRHRHFMVRLHRSEGCPVARIAKQRKAHATAEPQDTLHPMVLSTDARALGIVPWGQSTVADLG
jgi:hypothetical protein